MAEFDGLLLLALYWGALALTLWALSEHLCTASSAT